MKRIRTFVLSVARESQENAVRDILSIKSGKIKSQHTLPSHTTIMARVEREYWRGIEDWIAPMYSRHRMSMTVGYTELCEYTKSDMEKAEFFVVQFLSENIDLTQRYSFSEYNYSVGGRPRCWFAGDVTGPAVQIKKLQPEVTQSPGGLVASPAMFSEIYPDELRGINFDPITDSLQRIATGWSAWWPKHCLPNYDPLTTGVVMSGYAPPGVFGGGMAYCDTMESGFNPVYGQSVLNEMKQLSIHVARTRECYGIWPKSADDVKVAPQPRLVVSKQFRAALQSSHQRKLRYIPITAV